MDGGGGSYTFWKGGWFHRFTLDEHALAVFRIFLGSTLFIDLYIRFQDLVPHYTDEGVLPSSILSSTFADPWSAFALLSYISCFNFLFYIQVAQCIFDTIQSYLCY